MKTILACCTLISATFVWAAGNTTLEARSASVVRGEALEVRYAGSYTYLHLKTRNGIMWVALLRAPVLQGDTVTINNAIVIHNFKSRLLKKTFRTILLGTLNSSGANATSTHTGASQVVAVSLSVSGDIQIARARGANAVTVAEIHTERIQLKDRVVEVRGRVVKINLGIMGLNWVHLRDGTGSNVEATNDILVTTEQEVAIGEDVTAEGIVRTDVDFGSGYTYSVLIDDATFK